jgi:hypothetical protein
MPILDSELLWRPALLVSDSTPAQNGGRMNFAASIASGVKNNLFPDVGQAERLAGSETLRTCFLTNSPRPTIAWCFTPARIPTRRIS